MFIRVKKKSKFRNIKCSFGGNKFDSLGEMSYYKVLKLREAAGEIRILALQPKIYLTDAKILYKPDFSILIIKTNEIQWIDFKGARTGLFQLKKRLWKFYGPGVLLVVEKLKTEVITSLLLQKNK